MQHFVLTWKRGSVSERNDELFALLLNGTPHVGFLREATCTSHEHGSPLHHFRCIGIIIAQKPQQAEFDMLCQAMDQHRFDQSV